MNERIEKLVAQARKYAWENETHWSAGPEREQLFEQKFAELIVKECIEVINDRVLNSDGSGDWYKGYCDGAIASCREINQHFGVE